MNGHPYQGNVDLGGGGSLVVEDPVRVPVGRHEELLLGGAAVVAGSGLTVDQRHARVAVGLGPLPERENCIVTWLLTVTNQN